MKLTDLIEDIEQISGCMKVFIVSLCMFLVLNGQIGKAQEPEIFQLWPHGPQEENGLMGKSRVESNGRIVDNCVAELLVYRPQSKTLTDKAVIICPGGGYKHLAVEHEGKMFARWLNKRGITAVVLKYRMPNQQDGIPLADVQRTIRWVRGRGKEWGINPGQVGVAGFSAGGHLASTVATHFDFGKANVSDSLERFSSRPDFVILFYPVISMKSGLTHTGSKNALLGKNPSMEMVEKYSNEQQVTAQTPPAFLVHCDDDIAVPALNSVAFYQALKKNKVPATLYIFPTGGHGWGMNVSFDFYPIWTSLLENWLIQL